MAKQGSEGEMLDQETTKFALCHQREALAREKDFAFISETAELPLEDTQFHNLLDIEGIPWNFMYESSVGEEEIEMCIQKYLIPSSFLCRRGYGGETVFTCEVDWIGVYLGHF